MNRMSKVLQRIRNQRRLTASGISLAIVGFTVFWLFMMYLIVRLILAAIGYLEAA